MFNELRVNYQRVRDDRDGDTEFPALSIELGLGPAAVCSGLDASGPRQPTNSTRTSSR
jgi:hypothetical protein